MDPSIENVFFGKSEKIFNSEFIVSSDARCIINKIVVMSQVNPEQYTIDLTKYHNQYQMINLIKVDFELSSPNMANMIKK